MIPDIRVRVRRFEWDPERRDRNGLVMGVTDFEVLSQAYPYVQGGAVWLAEHPAVPDGRLPELGASIEPFLDWIDQEQLKLAANRYRLEAFANPDEMPLFAEIGPFERGIRLAWSWSAYFSIAGHRWTPLGDKADPPRTGP